MTLVFLRRTDFSYFTPGADKDIFGCRSVFPLQQVEVTEISFHVFVFPIMIRFLPLTQK
jgi:hypothetical protein